ncbi:type I-E CRISPR-associated protein Cse1/CasA [Micromonospora oryzae]|uniref:type I-E CRISPR-associated protein Cse1/CasA n=1 Tax=Micromonospora sp. DSM 102119 TaxID=3111768 RepID=UPI0031D78F15
MRFNLAEQPWLPVVRLDGTRAEVSLVTLLTEAHLIRRVLGQTPPMTAALHRLVLALMHRVYGPADGEAWAELWEAESLPDPTVPGPGETQPRLPTGWFELFDSDRPFFQCPGVSKVPASSAAKLVPHLAVGNNTTLFDHTTATDDVSLSPAEAARWLVTLQAYDPGGMKTPYTKDKSSQAAPANRMGMVLVEGGTLKETLLLNLLPYSPTQERPRNTEADDRPAWEAPPPSPEPELRHPKGWTDLLTWPSRRVWLVPSLRDGTLVVDQVVITPGTRLSGEPQDNEWMAAHRRPKIREGRTVKGQTTRPTYGPWYPVRLTEHRGVWRFSQELLLSPVGAEERHWQRPPTLDHVARMVMEDVIPRDAVYTLRVFGQQLDSKGSVVEQTLEETVAAPVTLLRAAHDVAGPVVGQSIQLANLVGSALNQMEREHRAQFAARSSAELALGYWPLLAVPFDLLLRALAQALDAGTSLGPATKVWAQEVSRIATDIAVRWAEGSPRRGRNLEAAGECYGRFVGQLDDEIRAYHGRLAGYIE